MFTLDLRVRYYVFNTLFIFEIFESNRYRLTSINNSEQNLSNYHENNLRYFSETKTVFHLMVPIINMLFIYSHFQSQDSRGILCSPEEQNCMCLFYRRLRFLISFLKYTFSVSNSELASIYSFLPANHITDETEYSYFK